VLIGIALAFRRRYIQKPDYLSATNPNQERFMYAMLVWLVVAGYLLEGLRIVGNHFPINEASWSPVGWFLALILSKFNLADPTLAYTYRTIWMLHMLNTMVL